MESTATATAIDTSAFAIGLASLRTVRDETGRRSPPAVDLAITLAERDGSSQSLVLAQEIVETLDRAATSVLVDGAQALVGDVVSQPRAERFAKLGLAIHSAAGWFRRHAQTLGGA